LCQHIQTAQTKQNATPLIHQFGRESPTLHEFPFVQD
jgi:hypothetical protein